MAQVKRPKAPSSGKAQKQKGEVLNHARLPIERNQSRSPAPPPPGPAVYVTPGRK